VKHCVNKKIHATLVFMFHKYINLGTRVLLNASSAQCVDYHVLPITVSFRFCFYEVHLFLLLCSFDFYLVNNGDHVKKIK